MVQCKCFSKGAHARLSKSQRGIIDAQQNVICKNPENSKKSKARRMGIRWKRKSLRECMASLSFSHNNFSIYCGVMRCNARADRQLTLANKGAVW